MSGQERTENERKEEVARAILAEGACQDCGAALATIKEARRHAATDGFACEEHKERLMATASDPIEVLHPDGRREEFAVLSFREVQRLVGGYVEAHALSSGWYVLLNEDGRRLRLRPNHRGTEEARARNNGERSWAKPGQSGTFVGVVVLLPPGRVSETLGKRG